MQAPYSAPVPPSPSVRCPKCGSELEGEFTFVDDVRCPVCRKVFFPPLPAPAPGARLLPKGVFRPAIVHVVVVLWLLSAADHFLALTYPEPPKSALWRGVVSFALAVCIFRGDDLSRWVTLVLAPCVLLAGPILLKNVTMGFNSAAPTNLLLSSILVILLYLLFAASLWILTRPRVSWWFRLPDKVPLP